MRGIAIALIITLVLPLQSGCGMLSKQAVPSVHGTAVPVSYRARAAESAKCCCQKVARGSVTTAKYVGAGVFMLLIWIIESALEDDDEDQCQGGFDEDRLWHAGYGFNNPNNERRAKGLPLLNFDGSVAD